MPAPATRWTATASGPPAVAGSDAPCHTRPAPQATASRCVCCPLPPARPWPRALGWLRVAHGRDRARPPGPRHGPTPGQPVSPLCGLPPGPSSLLGNRRQGAGHHLHYTGGHRQNWPCRSRDRLAADREQPTHTAQQGDEGRRSQRGDRQQRQQGWPPPQTVLEMVVVHASLPGCARRTVPDDPAGSSVHPVLSDAASTTRHSAASSLCLPQPPKTGWAATSCRGADCLRAQ